MWQRSYEAEAHGVSAEQIWQVWTDINRWNEWDDMMEYARTNEPFGKGCHFELKPKGGSKLSLEIAECEEGKYFVDQCQLFLATVRGHHEIQQTKTGGLRIKTTVTLTGPLTFLWRMLLVQKIVDGLPSDMANIIAAAKKRNP